jgi:hypothetical protein
VNDVLIAIREYLSGADNAGLRRVIDAPAAQWVNDYEDWSGRNRRCVVGHVRDMNKLNVVVLTDADERVCDAVCGFLGNALVFPPALVSSIHAIASEILTTRALAGVTDERATVEV